MLDIPPFLCYHSRTIEKGTTMKKQTLFYSKGSDTIRQAPENYLIATKVHNKWICDPDPACNQKFAVKIFKALFTFDNAYGTGENLLAQAGFKNDPQRI